MRHRLAAFAALSVVFSAHGAPWTYGARHDSFENVEILTATVRGENPTDMLVVVRSGERAQLLLSAAHQYDCFPACMVRMKFDDASPIEVRATSSRLLSPVLELTDHPTILPLLQRAARVAVRAPAARFAADQAFTIEGPIDPSQWTTVKALRATQKSCQDNAVNENYDTCMARKKP